MPLNLESSSRVAFGLYEADLQTGELWKAGRKIKLQSQPFKILAFLMERPGEVVSREELQTRLWGKGTVGDFDHSLGTAINKIREALSDTADDPRFVETLARRGYRFIAPVTVLSTPAAPTAGVRTPSASAANEAETEAPASAPPDALVESQSVPDLPSQGAARERLQFRRLRPYLAAALIPVAAGLGYLGGMDHPAALPRIERITHSGRISPGMPAMESLPALVTDGLRIILPEITGGRAEMAQVDVHTGVIQPVNVPGEIPSPGLGDLSPDGASLLVRTHLSPESEQPIWIVPTSGGSALRLANVVAHDATWMPDGKDVLYAAGDQLLIHHLADGNSKLFATLPGRAFWLRWSPDGALLRFTMLDPVAHTLSLWEVGRGGDKARQILAGWSQPASECCGVWSGDGHYFVYQSTRSGSSDLWRLDGKSTSGPVRVTNGPLSFEAPAMPRIGHRVFFLGLDSQASLLKFDPARVTFVPESDFFGTASRIEYSRDLKWVLWTDPQGRLWRARADGSELLQVTPDSLQVFLAHWSPDGQQVAMMARRAGGAWQIYRIAPSGGSPDLLLSESRNAADPSWSPDGQRLVFGRVTDVMGKEEGPRALQILDLRNHAVTTIPGSDGLFSPRWSPSGRYIAALSLDQRKLVVLDTLLGSWHTVAEDTAADPVWTSDSRYIIFHAAQAQGQPIYRASASDWKLERLADLRSVNGGETADYFFCGLTPDNLPIVRARTGTGDVYAMDLDEH